MAYNSVDYFEEMKKLANYKMPYGKYNGQYILDIPEEYIIWLRNKRISAGELDNLLMQVYDIKANGLESIVRKFRSS